ncbi:hypothetical protein RRG08_065315, partial [Elysia crispata]
FSFTRWKSKALSPRNENNIGSNTCLLRLNFKEDSKILVSVQL